MMQLSSVLSIARAAGKSVALAVGLMAIAAPLPSFAQVTIGVAIETAPPPLPYYAQPPAPAPNYMWQPGYWAWGPGGYYWVPGTWVLAPAVGMYWTPGYWAFNDGNYLWNNGYWGPSVGFYGGINYGFGYSGVGYVGGQWLGNQFAYNTAITNVDATVIHNVYVNRTVIVHRTVTTSYNGGPGGVRRVATPAETAAAQQRAYSATPAQVHHAQIAAQSRNQYETVNHGRPSDTAMAHPIEKPEAMPHYSPLTDADRAAAPKSKPPH
jgi:hypothetical protein